MDLVVYSQYYRTRTPDRQLEIDECLRRNLNHPGISRMVLFCESDAPPVPEGTVPVEVVTSDERITYAEWFRWVKRQGSGIGLLLNADIYLDDGLEQLGRTFDRPDVFLALTRYNPGRAGFHLNDYPHWTQDVWGVRADAELPESLLYASSFPLGFPGCDNRISYVLWSHGFHVRNPCYHVRSVHLQASTARGYDKTSDRLYGGVSYVHPSLAPNEDAELEFTLWTRSLQRPAGVLINQQAIEQGVHQLRHGEAEVAQRFLDLQQFTGLSWMHEAVGSAHLQGDPHPFASEDTVFLPMPALLGDGVELQLQRPTKLEGLTLRLPRRAAAGYKLELEAQGEGDAQLELQGDGALALKPGGERRFWQAPELKATPWQRLCLKLTGPATDPSWRDDEGAELVLFGEEGALDQAKSLNVIAEENGKTQPARLLRTVRFAAPEEVDPKNLTVQEGAIRAADGSPSGDALTGSSEANALKYAYNSYSTSETGAYTASLVLKAGTQTRIVLRINDQSGLNDARQAFDLAHGCKEGEAVNGGSATGATGRIHPLGGGWYRCSISGVFHEPLTCLHVPALWMEHYAPSSTTGTLYTGEAQVLQGVEANAPAEPAEQPAFALSASQADLAANADAPYRWRRRRDCQAQLASAEELHSYGNRFRVLRSGEELLFEDRFWPSVGASPIAAVPCGLEDAKGLLLWGFGQPALELRPGFIANTKRFSDDVNFWQYPCRTEGDAFAVHQSLVGPQLKDGVLQLFLGLPWATWIDRESWPTSTLKGVADRLQKLRPELERFGIGLKVHSVCQHILWRESLHLIKAAWVECLWLSHKPQAEDGLEGVELRAWHLYPVNAREADRRDTLVIKPMEQRPWLASFIGAHMKHYITDVRLRLQAFKDLHRFHIQLQDEWHFNPIVYGEQVGDPGVIARKGTQVVKNDTHRYNKMLSDSQFSLCPAGAGPNSLRLWESLAVGSIPVILSDQLALPDLNELSQGRFQTWDEIVLFHPEAELDSLPERLEAMPQEELQQRSDRAIALMELVNNHSCLGAPAQRVLPELKRQNEPDSSKPTIVVPVYGPTDRWYWRAKKHGFYNVVLEWYLRDYVNITFGEKGYFWWGKQGEILLMERDLVRDLYDRKLDPPRWKGEVPYKHAFFFNQYHLENSRNHKATYFTYALEHLEKVRDKIGRVGYDQRKYASIFAGSIENETQEFFRNKFKGWEEAIEVYSCADKLNKNEPHKFSMDEYLELVSQSRFGVCFRGNGPKCFREMEYLAMGTPLIITPGVEVNYPAPLAEGTHYFQASSREDIERIAKTTSQEQWTEMSRACWNWFTSHGQIDKIFEELTTTIQSFSLNARRHSVVKILAPRDVAKESLAARSLEISDIEAHWVADDDDQGATLVLNPNDLVINELPPEGLEDLYQWLAHPAQHPSYCNSIINSDLDVHKRLCLLMGLRFQNYRVRIEGPDGDIPMWDRMSADGIALRNSQEKAILTTDFDWSRRCAIKYSDETITMQGPGPICVIEVSARLSYSEDNRVDELDLSPHFNDYFTVYKDFPAPEEVTKICNLWKCPRLKPKALNLRTYKSILGSRRSSAETVITRSLPLS